MSVSEKLIRGASIVSLGAVGGGTVAVATNAFESHQPAPIVRPDNRQFNVDIKINVVPGVSASASAPAIDGGKPTQAPTPTPTPTPDNPTPADVNLRTVEIGNGTTEAAAKMFGADPYSENEKNWEMVEDGHAAHLKDTPDGKASRVKLVGTYNGVTQKAVVEGYLQIKNRVDTVQFPNPSQTEVLNPDQYPQADLTGGTFRVYEDTKAGFNDLWKTVYNEETDPTSDKYQKDVNVFEGCVVNHHEAVKTPIVRLTTEQAAKYFGVDKYSNNKNNWEVNQWGGLHLRPNGSDKTSRIKLKATIDGVTYYAVAEGYFELQRENNIKNPSQTEVVDGRVYDTVDLKGGTLWVSEEKYMDENFNKISQDVFNKETNAKLPNGKDNPDYQKNVIVYEFGQCETSDQTPSATATPTPTASPSAAAYRNIDNGGTTRGSFAQYADVYNAPRAVRTNINAGRAVQRSRRIF